MVINAREGTLHVKIGFSQAFICINGLALGPGRGSPRLLLCLGAAAGTYGLVASFIKCRTMRLTVFRVQVNLES